MKTRIPSLAIAVALAAAGIPGCTPIETPLKPKPGAPGGGPPSPHPSDRLRIVADSASVLDTEPVGLAAEGGSGEIIWDSEPRLGGLFSPEAGRRVLFTPPDLPASTTVSITAVDERRETARIEILVIDQGGPPLQGEVLINEIAWAGTMKSPYDEYVEIVNTGGRVLYLKDWSIDNAKGSGKPLLFSGRIDARSFFLITNYGPESPNTAILAKADCVDPGLSLSNSQFGPYVLRDGSGEVYDRVGDGGKNRIGLNTSAARSSAARFTGSKTPGWDENSWYTEGRATNLEDGTLGTPGAPNSDVPYAPGDAPAPGGGDGRARAFITEFSIGAGDPPAGVPEPYWVELFVTKGGDAKDFVVTDLDGTDSSISRGVESLVGQGEYLLVVWGGAPGREGNIFIVQDQRPTAVRDELVLLLGSEILDALCYSTDGRQPDDYDRLVAPLLDGGFGWKGEPIRGARGTRVAGEEGSYGEGRDASSWDTGAPPSPGGP